MMLRIKVTANFQGLLKIKKKLETYLKRAKCSPALHKKIEIIVDELASNIVLYAYPKAEGKLTLTITNIKEGYKLRFTDKGIPYNPLTANPPNIDLPMENRKIGGLGIYMVKKMASRVCYQHSHKKNHLTVFIK